MKSHDEPTYYEITAAHPDGRRYLVCYANGSPSGVRLRRCIWERGRALIDTLGLPEDAAFGKITVKPWPHVYVSEWRIGYSARTKHQIIMGNELRHPLVRVRD